MKCLIIGSGGREHALAWKISQSPLVEQIYIAPGNAGTALEEKCQNITIKATEIPALADFAAQRAIDLTIVGPEAPLAAGIVDHFNRLDLKCFGPTKNAAQLEASKAFSKDFMIRHGIPTASYQRFTHADEALAYIHSHPLPIVIKADGLAAGKGVIIAHSLEEAEQALEKLMQQAAGQTIVIEDFLEGEEASFMVMTDGENILPLATSQDHKARDDGDQGPNTGGMGAYSPAPVLTDALQQHVIDTIISPTLNGLRQEGIHYQGFLYAGLMISPTGELKVLEFNCRLGDPETQAILMRLNSDLFAHCLACLEGNLANVTPEWDPQPALGVVLAAGGYPEQYQKGHVIIGLDEPLLKQCKIFHAGTLQQGDNIVCNGGRILTITAKANTLKKAQSLTYSQANTIHWPNMHFRHDIGYHAIEQCA